MGLEGGLYAFLMVLFRVAVLEGDQLRSNSVPSQMAYVGKVV